MRDIDDQPLPSLNPPMLLVPAYALPVFTDADANKPTSV